MDLFNYNHNKQEDLMQQYKLYVELVDRISQRRALANTFYLTLNVALLSFIAGFKDSVGMFYLWFILVGGMVASLVWFFTIKSYKQLNTAKFYVIHEIEEKLPLNLFKYEWKQLKYGKSFNTYWPLTHIEKYVPLVFVALYFLFGIFYIVCGR